MKKLLKEYSVSLYEATKNASEAEVDRIIKNFVKVLEKNNCLNLGEEIIEEYKNYYRQQNHISRIKIKSNKKVSPEIMGLIMKKFQNQVEIEEEIDKNMIGGLILEIDENTLVDGSIDSKLKSIVNRVSK